mgnify:CR=1 FL=1
MSSRHDITLNVNGAAYRANVEARKTLVDAIREDCGLTGTHIGCEHGVCGACSIRVDGVVLGFALALALAVAVLLAYAPRFVKETALGAWLAGAGRSSANRRRQRIQRGLVVAQIAVSVVLLTGAGLLTRTMLRLADVDTGFDADQVLTMEVPVDEPGRSQADQVALYQRMQTELAAIPGVTIRTAIDTMWSARGRLGWVVANNILLFGTAGYGGMDVAATATVSGLTLTGNARYSGFVYGGGAEVLLFIAGGQPQRTRREPDLQKMRRLPGRIVEFAVRHAAPGAHALHVAGLDDAAVRCACLSRAHAVAVRELSAQHVADDFHVAVAVRAKTRSRGDAVFIDDAQVRITHVLRVVIVGKRKAVKALQPAVVGVASIVGFPQGDHMASFDVGTAL